MPRSSFHAGTMIERTGRPEALVDVNGRIMPGLPEWAKTSVSRRRLVSPQLKGALCNADWNAIQFTANKRRCNCRSEPGEQLGVHEIDRVVFHDSAGNPCREL